MKAFVSEVRRPVEAEAEQAEPLTGWLSNRLGRDAAAPDFAARGFHLIGGRLLPGGTGPAAMFMYENGSGQRITLHVAPSEGKDTAFRSSESGSTRSFWWRDGGLSRSSAGRYRSRAACSWAA